VRRRVNLEIEAHITYPEAPRDTMRLGPRGVSEPEAPQDTSASAPALTRAPRSLCQHERRGAGFSRAL
jgi:hypothetical protein